MKWNPRLDLVAVVLITDELCLHRLVGWQKVWSLNCFMTPVKANTTKTSPPNDAKISCIEWRPDGRILCVAFTKCSSHDNDGDGSISNTDTSGSFVALIEIESSDVIHVIDMKCTSPDVTITCLNWTSKHQNKSSMDSSYTEYFYFDAKDFLPELKAPVKPSSISGYGSTSGSKYGLPTVLPMRKLSEDNLNDFMKVTDVDVMSILSVGTSDGQVALFGLGLMRMATILVANDNWIMSVGMSDDLSLIQVVHLDTDGLSIRQSSYSMAQLLSLNSKQWLAVCHIYSRIMTLCRYMRDTMTSILESWEDLMLELESKLSPLLKDMRSVGSGKTISKDDQSYDSSQDDDEEKSRLSDEFMELLVFGMIILLVFRMLFYSVLIVYRLMTSCRESFLFSPFFTRVDCFLLLFPLLLLFLHSLSQMRNRLFPC